MPDKIKHVLIIEDTHTDAELLLHRLDKRGYDFEYQIVETRAQVESYLEQQSPELVISDFNLPTFNGLEALEMIKEHDKMIPFILLSGTIDQQQETEILEKGANEVILKSNLNRLPFAVRRVLYEVRDRRRLQKTTEQLQVLLQEVHHRVKNNLQVISGLLQLRRMNAREEEMDLIQDMLVKVRSIARVHELLYETNDFINIDLAELINDLAEYTLKVTAGEGQNHELNCDVESIRLNVNQAVPCGMILSELIHNAIKHGVIDDSKIKIIITGKQYNGSVRVRVADNGKGLPEDFTFEDSEGMGSSIILTLLKQLDADYEISNENGTDFTFEFPKNDLSGVHSNIREL